MLLASLLGTYLDLYFTGKGMYQFPHRPLSELFSVNIAFTLVGLPLLVLCFLHASAKVNKWGKAGLILFTSLLMPVMEKLAELLGWFVHSEDWRHIYTFFGYLVFLSLVAGFHGWMKRE